MAIRDVPALSDGDQVLTVDGRPDTSWRSVAPIGNALELTVGWIRSRLPRYPLIPAPQLASKGYRRCEEYGLRLRWRKQVLQAGLQYQESPPGLAQALRLPTPQTAISATLALATALRDTDEWREYTRLSESLRLATMTGPH